MRIAIRYIYMYAAMFARARECTVYIRVELAGLSQLLALTTCVSIAKTIKRSQPTIEFWVKKMKVSDEPNGKLTSNNYNTYK